MGSECNQTKRQYDLSMSKRTRKPLKPKGTDPQAIPTSLPKDDPSAGVEEKEDVTDYSSEEPTKLGADRNTAAEESLKRENPHTGVDEKNTTERRSLKDLMTDGEGEFKVVDREGKLKRGQRNRGSKSLSYHFREEEKQLQLVVKQQGELLDGVKKKEKVSRYIKVLSHLIGDPQMVSRQKPILKLTM